ncbi:MAG TPA: DEAD/DEAH box helicase, partial [Candidatus Aenigmarchaeota archaeon]|nr:DEAD/DEAH box helicase [Candidatus Aenigmarchaeota archaeon]
VVELVMKQAGIKKLNPVQHAALKAGILDGNNVVIAAPTASGKTLVAEFAAINAIRQGKKAIYIVPLRALANEKYNDFKEKYEKLGIKVGISTGDLDSSDSWLAKYDIIIVTSEKLDSLLRHNVTWVYDAGVIIADEVHLLNDPTRGPTLEILLTKLRESISPQFVCLSATIRNYEEIAEWINARGVEVNYRPVTLYKGVYFDNKVRFFPEKGSLEAGGLEGLVRDTLKRGKQALIFVSTRRNAEALAEKLAKLTKGYVGYEDGMKLLKIANKIEHALEHKTRQCERLAFCIRNGSAFHHAGIVNEQRNEIEQAFKDGLIKIIVATPTLAAGINLPAYRVIIRDIKRYDASYGMDYIPVLEIEQMMGRAGRPKYDKEGEAIIIAKNKKDANYIWEQYITGETERITSKLGVEPILRMHILALIAADQLTTNALLEFFSKTFYAYQYKAIDKLFGIIEHILLMLKGFGFIEINNSHGDFVSAYELLSDKRLKATLIGRRVSELYIDPITAHKIISSLKHMKCISDIGILQLLSNTNEMKPLLGVRQNEFKAISEFIVANEDMLIEKVPDEWDIEYEDYIRSIKTAMLFMDWIDEMGEDKILEKYNVTPGELRVRIENMDWLLYAMHELALLLGYKDILKEIRKLRIRLKYGIRAELLPFVKLKGIGRVKARTLHNSGIRSLSDLRKIPLHTLERIIGTKTARDIKNQLARSS